MAEEVLTRETWNRDAPDLHLSGDGPVYAQIEQAIRDQITSGTLRPGDRIPAEVELMKTFGTSRATVGKALNNLAAAGLLERRRKRGSFVAKYSDTHTAIEIIDIRKQIEAKAGKYEFIMLERATVTKADRSFGWPEVADDATVLFVMGVHCADGSPQVLEERLIALAVAPDAPQADFNTEPPSAWLLSRLACTKLVNTISARLATPRESQLLQVPRNSALLISERKTWCGADPVTIIRLCYPGDRHSFVGVWSQENGAA